MPAIRILISTCGVLASVAISGCTTSTGVTTEAGGGGRQAATFAAVQPTTDADIGVELPTTVAALPLARDAVEKPVQFAAMMPADARASPEPAFVTQVAVAKPAEVFPQAPAAPQTDLNGQPPIQTAGASMASAVSSLAAPLIEPVAFAKADAPAGPVSSGRPRIDSLIEKYAAVYELPVDFVHKVVKRESTYNPAAYNRGHWGLMQIKHATARGMGYTGTAKGLLDPETNLKYAVKYLKGAYLVADGDTRLADRMYQRGYYYDAKRKGLLDETGLGKDRTRKRRPST